MHGKPGSPGIPGRDGRDGRDGAKGDQGSGRKNVMSMRELFCPDLLAGFEKMAGFQIFYCLKIKCFHS